MVQMFSGIKGKDYLLISMIDSFHVHFYDHNFIYSLSSVVVWEFGWWDLPPCHME